MVRTLFLSLALCALVARSLSRLDTLDTLGLMDNRLTASSVPTIVMNLTNSLVNLDLSINDLHGAGAAALARYFQLPTSLEYLDIHSCLLTDDDLRPICIALSNDDHCLKTWNISHNKISVSGMQALCDYFTCRDMAGEFKCRIQHLDISWNELQYHGCLAFANALATWGSACTLQRVDVTANSITDEGAQRIGASLLKNKSMVELNLCQNGLGGKSCFVLARVRSNGIPLRSWRSFCGRRRCGITRVCVDWI